MGKAFNIADFAKTMQVSNSDTREQIEYIDMDLISADERNFYELSDIDDLAANIQLLGLQQPIRVRAVQGGASYTIVSGHRRMAALQKLVEDGEERFRSVPCIVETDEASPAMQELRLIFANSATRKLSSADLGKQAERIEALLYQLQEEGYEFPGRMRDHVAAACQVSRTKLATIAAIKNNLPQPFLGQWERGELTESAAYELSKIRSKGAFLCIEEAIGEKYIITGNVAKKLADHADALLENHAKHRCPNGTTCQNTIGFFKGACKQKYEYNVCDGTKCCVDCWHKDSCSGICSVVRQQKKEDATERKLEREREEERQRKKKEKLLRDLQASAKRLVKAIDAVGLADDAKIEGFNYYGYFTVGLIRDVAGGHFASTWHNNSLDATQMSKPLTVAQTINCSMDYLYGLTDDLHPQQNSEICCNIAAAEGQLAICGWMPGGTYPRDPGDVVAVFDADDGVTLRKICYYADGKFYFKKGGAVIDAKCVKWLQLPQDE